MTATLIESTEWPQSGIDNTAGIVFSCLHCLGTNSGDKNCWCLLSKKDMEAGCDLTGGSFTEDRQGVYSTVQYV